MKKDNEKAIVKRLCQRLHDERLKQGLSQQRVSEVSGLSRTGVRHIESLETNPTLYSLLKLAKALDLKLTGLF